jgi:hypothetical protein
MTIVGALIGLVPGLTLGLALVAALVPVLWVGAVMPIVLPISVPTVSLTILGFLVVHLLVTALLYLFLLLGTGAPVIGAPTPTNALEELARGALIGMSTGINLTVLGSLPLLSLLAIPVALVNFLACIPAISNNRFYQVVLTYFALAMPATLPINLFGFGCLIVNVAALALGLAPFTWFADWTHANYVTHGGITHGPQVTAWNQCNFTIAHPAMSRTDPWLPPGAAAPPRADTVDGDLFHEGMHTANVAAFGWAFHLVGFIDAVVRIALGAPGINAYAEMCAEGGHRGATRPWLALWTPSLQPPAPVNDPPIGNYGIVGAGAVDMGDATFGGIRETAVVRGTPLVATTTSPPFAFIADVNGTYPEPLGFLWRTGTGVLAAPGLAVAQVGGATFAFTPTTAGDTVVSLDATDGADGIARFQVVHALGAAIAPPPAGTVGNPVSLDASASTAGLSDLIATPRPLAFLWEVIDQQPPGPPPVLGNAAAALATLTANAGGVYTVRVTVSATFPTAGPGPATQTLSDTATTVVPIP